MQAQAHAREVSIRIREGKDGPQQYARIVLHVEIPDAKVQSEVFGLARLQKVPLVVDIGEAQLELPAAAGMKG
jgi:predicted aspartyl protease